MRHLSNLMDPEATLRKELFDLDFGGPAAAACAVAALLPPEDAALEAALAASLGIPPAPGAGEAPGDAFSGRYADAELGQLLSLLHQQVLDMERKACEVGAIPANYPLPVELVMKLISALLPWYTRPIREFAALSSSAAATLAGGLAALARARGAIPPGDARAQGERR